MSEISTLVGFPARRVTAAVDAVRGRWAQVERAFRRSGQVAPAPPSITPTNLRSELVCDHCRETSRTAVTGDRCFECGLGHVHRRLTVDLIVTADRPRFGGWELLAVLEPVRVADPEIGGNLIRRVPGAAIEETELDSWRTWSGTRCDHCRVSRRRSETFLVRADGSDPQISAGTIRQVGRNCLSAFLGGLSVEAVLHLVGWPAEIVDAGWGDGDGGGGAGGPVDGEGFDPNDVVRWTAAVIRIDGWRSRTTAREDPDRGRATADLVEAILSPPRGRCVEAHVARQQKYRPTDEDARRGDAALVWARGIAAEGRRLSDYEHNLHLIGHKSWIDRGYEVGILASAVIGHARSQGEAQGGASAHVGVLGEKIDLRITIERVTKTLTDFGPLRIVSMRSDTGDVLIWKTSSEVGVVTGDVRQLRGTIKAHDEFRGVKQTVVTRCKIADPASTGASPLTDATERDASVASASPISPVKERRRRRARRPDPQEAVCEFPSRSSGVLSDGVSE